MYNKLIILGIETSCDDTGISIYNNKNGILSEYIYNQTSHIKYGGTIPELASRDHLKRIMKLILLTLKKVDCSLDDINCIAYTKGPGLNGPLLIGATIGKSLSYALKIPSIGINHLKAHIAILFAFRKKIIFPSLVLLISGAHTLLLKMLDFERFCFIGGTLDDGIGETFDKIARSLHLIPMNGISIEKKSKNDFKFKNLRFPQPLSKYSTNFSFSGLKTSVINTIKISNINSETQSNIAYNFQNTIIKMITDKCKIVLNEDVFKSILLAGGVSSNKELRLALSNIAESLNIDIYLSPKKYCTDNGSMIAFLGFVNFITGKYDTNFFIKVFPDLKFN